MKLVLLLLIVALSGCASYTNLNDGRRNNLGGGFQDQKIGDGLFYVLAKTNWAPWENFGGANSTFHRRATELCGRDYKVLKREEISYESMPGMRGYIISQVEGYVLSASSHLSEEEARKLIDAHLKRGARPTTASRLPQESPSSASQTTMGLRPIVSDC